jgi:hypothetical protein
VNIVAMALGLLVVITTGIGYWAYVFWPIFKGKSKLKDLGSLRNALLQIPITIAVLMTASGFKDFVYAAIFPPAFLILLLSKIAKFLQFLSPVITISMLVAATIQFMIFHAFRSLRFFTWSITTIAFIIVFFISADLQTKNLQSIMIQNGKFDCVNLESFWYSAKKRGYEILVGPHTTAKRNGKSYGWSFQTLDFYEIPQSVSQNIEPLC